MQEIINKLQELEDKKSNIDNDFLLQEYTLIAVQLFSKIEDLKSKKFVQIIVRDTLYKIDKLSYEHARETFKNLEDKTELLRNFIVEEGIPISTIVLNR